MPRREEDEGSDDEDDQGKIEEEFSTWKKNTPYLYDLVIAHSLLWPSLTVQWLPGREIVSDRDYSKQQMILGTHTSGENEPNHLMIAEVLLPLPDFELPEDAMEDGRSASFGFASAERRINIVQRINHEGEVNKARYMPQDPNIIATKTNSGEVHVFNRSAQAASPPPVGVARPDIRLGGHKTDGFGLAWSPHDRGQIASGSNDHQVCVWDIGPAPAKGKKPLDPTAVFHHQAEVSDVAWHPVERCMLGSVGDDKMLILWDTRQPADKAVLKSANAHDEAIYSLAFHPKNQHLLVTGAGDHDVALWDLRSLDTPLHTMSGHKGDVVQVAWSPHCEAVLASAGSDRRVMLWDISRIGDEQGPEDSEDGPPELLFVHGGHKNIIPDMCWNPDDPWTMASVGDDNCIMVWKPYPNIWEDSQGRTVPEDLRVAGRESRPRRDGGDFEMRGT